MSSAVAAGTTGDAGASTLPDPGPGDRGAESSGANADAPSSSGLGSQGRKVSTQDIQLVQNLIERCLQMYMSQREVVFTLQQQAQIEPGFTQLVWQKLEEQNPDFFRAYYTRLKLKDQIVLFNHLLEQQVAMFQKMQRQWMAPSGSTHAEKRTTPLYAKINCTRPPLHVAQMTHSGPPHARSRLTQNMSMRSLAAAHQIYTDGTALPSAIQSLAGARQPELARGGRRVMPAKEVAGGIRRMTLVLGVIAAAGMMMAPRPMMMMPGMQYQNPMSVPSSLPALSLGQPLSVKVEEMSEGAGRSDGGQLGDTDMDIAGLSVPPAQGMDGLHGAAQTHPFSSADLLGMAPMAMSSPLRTGGSGDLGMGRNLSFSNFGAFSDFDNLGSNADHSMLQSHAPRDLPRNFSLSELTALDDLDNNKQGGS